MLQYRQEVGRLTRVARSIFVSVDDAEVLAGQIFIIEATFLKDEITQSYAHIPSKRVLSYGNAESARGLFLLRLYV